MYAIYMDEGQWDEWSRQICFFVPSEEKAEAVVELCNKIVKQICKEKRVSSDYKNSDRVKVLWDMIPDWTGKSFPYDITTTEFGFQPVELHDPSMSSIHKKLETISGWDNGDITVICEIDATELRSNVSEDDDNYTDSPLIGKLRLSMFGNKYCEPTKKEIVCDDHIGFLENYITPLNMSAFIHDFVFSTMRWNSDDNCNDPKWRYLGDCFYNSGLENYCIPGKKVRIEVDANELSESFGKILREI